MYGTIWVAIGLAVLISLAFLLKKSKTRIPVIPLAALFVVSIVFSLSVDLVFHKVFEQRHRDRFSLWLRLEKDPAKLEEIRKTIGYNTYQSEKAIESGGFFGKGFLEGTRTKGDFVRTAYRLYLQHRW